MENISILGNFEDRNPSTLFLSEINNLYNWTKEMSKDKNIISRTDKLIDTIVETVREGQTVYLIGNKANRKIVNSVSEKFKSLHINTHSIAFNSIDIIDSEDLVIVIDNYKAFEEIWTEALNTFFITFNRSNQVIVKSAILLPELNELDCWNKVPTTTLLGLQLYFDTVILKVADALNINQAHTIYR